MLSIGQQEAYANAADYGFKAFAKFPGYSITHTQTDLLLNLSFHTVQPTKPSMERLTIYYNDLQ